MTRIHPIRNVSRLRVLVVAFTALGSGPVQANATVSDCGPVTIQEPVAFHVTNNRQPLFWQQLPGATSYRVQLDSRVPEGERIFAVDTIITSPPFIPARPLTDTRANVRVTITPMCQGLEGKPTHLQFYVETAPACGRVERIRLETRQGTRLLTWQGVNAASGYGIWVYTPDSGRLLANAQVQETSWALPADLVSPAIISLRPVCAHGQGGFSFLLF